MAAPMDVVLNGIQNDNSVPTKRAKFHFSTNRTSLMELIEKALESGLSVDLEKYFLVQEGSDVEKKLTVDQCFRDKLKQSITDSEGNEKYLSIITLSIEVACGGNCSPLTPFLLLSDVFDCLTLEQCDEIFQYVENRVGTWKSEALYSYGKNYLLRMCNDLLRRLSTAQNTVFCGRIQMFLARLFPLSEKSALNLMSQFNIENITIYNKGDDGDGSKADISDRMDVDVSPRKRSSAPPIDYHIYRKFWSQQDFFRNPNQCYDKKLWKSFTKNGDDMFSVFSSHKIDNNQLNKRKHEDEIYKPKEKHYFAKYLTNEKLMDLQLSDSNFRRHVLIQYLILFQYLKGVVKFKSHVLSDDMTGWIEVATSKIYKLIQETPPDGKTFAQSVEHILAREENWINWKNEGCPSFTNERHKDNKPRIRFRARKQCIADDFKDPNSKKIDLGNLELTRLWNICPNNLEACSRPERNFVPSIESYFEDAVLECDPESQVENEYKSINNANFQWKALRVLARKSPHFFQANSQPFKSLPQYLEGMLSKIAKEMPHTQDEVKEELKTLEDNDVELLKSGENPEQSSKYVTLEQIEALAERLPDDSWKDLAVYLEFKDDLISVFEEASETSEQALTMLQSWLSREDTLATKDILIAALKSIDMEHVAKAVFTE